MPVVQDARAGTLRRRFGAAAIAAIIVVTQATAVALAAPPGTSLTATKTTTGHLVRTFPWTLSKTVDPSSLTLSSGESDSVTYTVGATKGSAVQSAYFDGQICVTNTGVVATEGLAIRDVVTKPPSKVELGSTLVTVSAQHAVLVPGETYCYTYRVDIFTAVTPGATYKDTASVTITNKASGKSGPAPSATAILPTTVEVTNNDSITVADTNGSSFTFAATGTQTYDTTFTCPADAGSHENTVSATGFVSTPSVPAPASASATVDVTCLSPALNIVKEGPIAAHHGDVLNFTFAVSTSGPGSVHDVHVTDDHCSPVSTDPINKLNDDGDALLDPIGLDGLNPEVWIFSCSMSVAAHDPGEENPIHNVATASALDDGDAIVTATDDHSTLLLHPGIDVDKTPDVTQASIGDTVTYTFVVTNTGDTPLTVVLSDPKCDATPSGPAGDSNNDSKLDTSETWTYTCTHLITAGDADPLHNVVTVTGTDDLGGPAGTATDTDEADVDIIAPNQPPVNTVPGAQSVDEDTDLTFAGTISISDPDAGSNDVEVTLVAENGTLTLSGTTGLAFSTGDGTSDALMVFAGSISDINTALNGLTYRSNLNFNVTRGSETLTITTDDQGNTGTGGPLTDTDTVDITVNAVNDAPIAVAKNYNAQANMKIVGLGGLLTGATDPDTGDSGYSAVFTVGTVSATTPAGGIISNLNTANGTFDFDPPPGATGNVTFTFTVCDNGNPGPSACSAPAIVTVSVAGPVIWFVNPAAGVNGDGRLSSPFNTLASAAAVDAAGHRIFLYTGTATTGITLNTDEWLIGQGVTGSGGTPFDTLFGITPPSGTIARPTLSGTRPIVQGNVAMATTDAVRGLNIQPASGTSGLTATSATSLTVGEVSVTTVNAAAVNLSSSGGTISLTSVSANGGSNGIVLNNTTGSFTVTASGGTCTEANTSGCSGGTIQNMAGGDDSSATPVGTGIVLNNAAGVSLTRMYIHDHTNYGIRGTGVAGFALDTSVVNGVNGTNVASPFSDGSISFDNLSGTSAITNTAVAGGYQRNIRVDNTTGTLTLTVNNDSIHNTGAAFGDDGLFVEIGGGTATLTVTNNTFAAHGGDHFNLSLLGTPTVALTFTGNFWTGGHAIGLGQGLFILAASFDSPGTLTYNISNNGTVGNPLVGNNSGGAMHVNKGSGTGSFSGTISNNVIGNPAVNSSGSLNASGIDVEAHGSAGSHTTVISNNLVRQFHNDGILLVTGEGNAALNATVTGNTVSDPDASLASFHGMHFNIGTLPTDAGSHCLDVRNNTLTNAANEANGGVDLRMRQRQLTTVRLPGYAGANNDNTAVQNFLTTTNANALTTILASNSVATGGGGFVGGAACPLP